MESLLYLNLLMNGTVLVAVIVGFIRVGRVLERQDQHGKVIEDHETRLRVVEGR